MAKEVNVSLADTTVAVSSILLILFFTYEDLSILNQAVGSSKLAIMVRW